MSQEITMTDPAGTLGAHAGSRRIAAGQFPKALERNLLKVEHDHPLPLLDPTLGEVHSYPSNLNETRIPRRWKCFRRGCPMQRSGKV